VGDELDTPRGEQLKSLDLQGEVGNVRGNGEFQEEKRPQGVIREKSLGVAGVNEDSAEDEPADPDNCAAKIDRARLQHLLLREKLIEKLFEHVVGNNARNGINLTFDMKNRGRRLIHMVALPQGIILINCRVESAAFN